MLPLELEMENFYCYTKSVINFNDFSAAVIVGKINGNDKFSNGSGKSTIFNAIKYVLFNEVETSSLERIIKHNADWCRVSFTFQPSIDGQTYKIVRFRGKRAGAEVRLFRLAGENWEDLTQRTPTETDKEILKLLKINYRTFSNSILFSQGDLSGIAAMTPRERKTALKEALQLGIYSKYEAAIKKKVAELTKEVEKNQTILSTLGNPDLDIVKYSDQLKGILPSKQKLEKEISFIENNISTLQKEIVIKQKELNDLSLKINENNKSYLEVKNDILNINAEIEKYTSKVSSFEKQEEVSFQTAKLLYQEIKALKSFKLKNGDDLKKELDISKNLIIECQSELKQLQAKQSDLKIPLTSGSICKHCRQPTDPAARELCQKAIDLELLETTNKINTNKETLISLQKKYTSLDNEQENTRKSLLSLKEKEFELEKEKKNTISLSDFRIEFRSLIHAKEKELKIKENHKLELIKQQDFTSLKNNEDNLNKELISKKTKLDLFIKDKKMTSETISNLSNEEAVLEHKIKQKTDDKDKIVFYKETLVNLERQFAIHQKVLTAFGPSGIPALITHTILDDYQVESNNMLDRLRPGLRLQFLTENERSDGEMADTLEITYFLNNTELEFTQLSGAQKLLVSLALRLGLAAVISKRLGIDLKMILIDEADQSLDEAALETFEQAVKELQKDYKILIITHNNELKIKFNHAIVVEQDNNLHSTAKVVNGW